MVIVMTIMHLRHKYLIKTKTFTFGHVTKQKIAVFIFFPFYAPVSCFLT